MQVLHKLHLQLCLILLLGLLSYSKAQGPLVLYSTKTEIRYINTTRTKQLGLGHAIIKNLTDGAAIDYHYQMQKVCWANNNPDNLSIQCAGFNSTHINDKIEIISTGIRSPDGLACDWFTSKLYWTDSALKGIEVASMIDLHRKVIYWTDIDQPRAIALDPLVGLIFWTDWGEVPKIERAGMNGDHNTRKAIVTENIFWPNGLTLDLENRQIYWIDGKMLFLKRMDYDGANASILINKGLQYPFALTQYGNRFFWTDWKDWSIWMCDRNSAGRAQKKLFLNSDAVPMDIHIWDKSKQPYRTHPCESNNGNCSHLCLLSPTAPYFTCACPIGIKLIDKRTCADEPQELLVFARKTEIGIIYLDSEHFTERILNLTNVVHSIAIDYDPIDKYIYWTDTDVKKIQRAKLDGTEQSDVLSYEIDSSDGIAIDWVARNIYWTESTLDRIEVATLDGKYRKVIISDGLLDPRGIAVAPSLGWLFWSDWNDKNPKIERSNLDGSERLSIITQDLSWVNGIALDIGMNRIYWCDAKNDAIEFADMDGNNRMVLNNDNIPHPFGFSILGEYLYWTDWQKRTISRINKDTGGNRQIIVDQISNIMGIKAINGSKEAKIGVSNPCGLDNGGCEQICLHLHNKTYTCACQIGYERRADGKTCSKPNAYLLYTKKNGVNYLGIENPNNEVPLPLVNVKFASSLDLDVNDYRIYWSDSKQRSIMSAYVNGSDPRKVIDLGLASPQGIAVDYVSMNIYWADPALYRIEVARLSGTSRRVLLHSTLEPHSIALDPQEGYMYWTEWSPSERSDSGGNGIKKAAMDGSNVITLILTAGYATTLVFHERRLYWVVTATPNYANPGIFSSDLNGLDKRAIVANSLNRPIGLAIYKDFIFWSDEIRDGESIISKANKITGQDRSVIHTTSSSPTDLLLVNIAEKRKKLDGNKCGLNNGDCPNLCLALPREPGYTCACPTHYTSTNNTCEPPRKFMAYSYKNLVVRLLPDTSEYLEAVLPIQGLKSVKAIDFDPTLQFLYWIEGKSHSIKRAKAVDVHINVVVEGNDLINPFDIAVDSLGRSLFWSCTIENVINMTRLDNSSNISVIVKDEGEKPRLLAVHSTKRLLIYTDISDSHKIIRRNVDGTNKKVLVDEKSQITAMAVDAENDLVVWTQGSVIYKVSVSGGEIGVAFNDSGSKINHLAVHSGWLYWIDKEDLQKTELMSSKSNNVIKHSTILDRVSDISDLVSVIEPDRTHPCSHLYCSHLCIMSSAADHGSKAVCACPPDSVLQNDKTTCATKADCGPDHFTCNGQEPKSKDCIPRSWRCDGQRDCSDGSDEAGCPACKPHEFRCHNGDCIDEKFHCDSHAHCKDKSDEAYCCKSDEFQCPKSQVCISRVTLCDGYENCADGADETKSVCSAMSSQTSEGLFYGISPVFLWIITSMLLLTILLVLYFYVKRIYATPELTDQAADPLNPDQPHAQVKAQKHRNKSIPDVVHMSMLKGSPACSYDRGHITGASSSTNGSSSMACYPRETLNPPPSPATTAASTRTSSPSARFRPYKHYKSINKPPPPTPCSTDVCDESDYNYSSTARNRYDGGDPFPPPPTPRSHCNSESCPPSPSSRSSTYFSPLPPPPSPVASPTRNFD